MAFLGVPGQMLAVRCVSDEVVDHVRPSSMRASMGGRVKAQVGPMASRTWALRLGQVTSASEASVLTSVVRGEYGRGPWWWLSDTALVTNLLPPDVSLLMTGQEEQHGVRASFPMRLPDGNVSGRSVFVEPGRVTNLTWKNGDQLVMPTIPGIPITVSAFLDAGVGHVNVQTLLANGQSSRSFSSANSSGAGVQRLARTMIPTVEEVAFRVRVIAASQGPGVQATRPAVTFTDEPTPWAIGGGAEKTIITQQSLATTLAWKSKQLVGSDYTIVEVG